MKYLIGEEFVLEVPVKVTAIDLDGGCLGEAVKYTLKGKMADGISLYALLTEVIKKEEVQECKK